MRFHTYSKYDPSLADAIDLQGLLDKLVDFLLQSGFAGGPLQHPYWGDFGGDEPDDERVVAQLEGQPPLRHRLHPRADLRQRLPGPEAPEVAVRDEDAERVERRGGHRPRNMTGAERRV